MDKRVLVQYSAMMEEIKDIRWRREKAERELKRLKKEIVADTVKGTRRDGTYGPIKIEGIADPTYWRRRSIAEKYTRMLKHKEQELLELATQAEEYIESIENAEMRSMLRFSIIDGMTNIKTAEAMNRMFPKRRVKYTDEGVKKRIQRFFQNVPQCPVEM